MWNLPFDVCLLARTLKNSVKDHLELKRKSLVGKKVEKSVSVTLMSVNGMQNAASFNQIFG